MHVQILQLAHSGNLQHRTLFGVGSVYILISEAGGTQPGHATGHATGACDQGYGEGVSRNVSPLSLLLPLQLMTGLHTCPLRRSNVEDWSPSDSTHRCEALNCFEQCYSHCRTRSTAAYCIASASLRVCPASMYAAAGRSGASLCMLKKHAHHWKTWRDCVHACIGLHGHEH